MGEYFRRTRATCENGRGKKPRKYHEITAFSDLAENGTRKKTQVFLDFKKHEKHMNIYKHAWRGTLLQNSSRWPQAGPWHNLGHLNPSWPPDGFNIGIHRLRMAKIAPRWANIAL